MDLQGFYLFLIRNLPKQTTADMNLSLVRSFFLVYPKFTQKNIDTYFITKIEDRCKGSYLNRVRTALLHYAEYSGVNVTIGRFKELQSLQTTMSDEEIERLLALPPPAGNSGVGKWERWKMFWTIAAYSGMRPGNVASLTVEQVDFGQTCFILPDTKTDPARIPMNPLIIPTLEEYIKNTKDYLFPIHSEKAPHKVHVEKPDWSHNFQVRVRMLGIKRIGLRPYSLRHSLCTRLVDLNENIFRVAQVMNHKNISITERYYHQSMKQAQLTIQKDPLGKRNLPGEVLKQIKNYINSLEINEKQFEFVQSNERIEVRIK